MRVTACLASLIVAVQSLGLPRIPSVDGHHAERHVTKHLHLHAQRTAAILETPSCVDDPFGITTATGGCAVAVAALGCDSQVSPQLPGATVWMLCPASCNRCICMDNPLAFSIGGCDALSVMGCNRVLTDLGVTQTVGDLCPGSCGWCHTGNVNASGLERAVLQTVYDSMGGSGWVRSSGWGTGSDPCQAPWDGVHCTAGRITALRLDSNNLQGTVPESVRLLTMLKTLDLSSNKGLTGTLPSITTLTELERLVLAESGMSGVLPELPATITHLVLGEIHFPVDGYPIFSAAQHIESQGNSFTVDLDDMVALPKLKLMEINYNDVRGQFTQAWCDHGIIEEIDVSFSLQVTGVIPDCFESLPRLKKIGVSGTGLTGTIPSTIFKPGSNLVRFEAVATSGLSGVIPDNIGNGEALRVVFLDDLKLSGTIPPSLCDRKEMQHIGLGTMAALAGTIPESCGNMPEMQIFALYNSNITGTIPQSFENMVKVAFLYFHDLDISGTLPDIFGNMNDLVGLYLNLNPKLSGTIPDSTLSRPKLTTVAASTVGLQGQLPEVVSPVLSFAGFGMNNLSGTIPDTWCNLPELETLWLQRNENIGGTIPNCIDGMKILKFLRLDHNFLSGTIPASLTKLNKVTEIRLMNNNLMSDGTLPDFNLIPELKILDLSSNPLNVDVNTLLVPAGRSPKLIQLGCSECGLTGPMLTQSFYVSGNSEVSKFQALQRFSLAGNNLTGSMPHAITYSLFLITFFDVSRNNLAGTVPNIFGEADGVLAEENPLLKGPLPDWITPDTHHTTSHGEGEYDCAVMKGAVRDIIFKVDPSYYSFEHCSCAKTYWGTPPHCQPCLKDAVCPGGEDILIPPEYYPAPSLSDPTHVLQCYGDAVDSNPCNPNYDNPWRCADGYVGRLCGRCDDGYYSVGRQCAGCPSDGGVVGLMIVVVLLCLTLLVGIKFWSRSQQLLDLMRLAVFFAQVQAVLLSGSSFLWPVEVKNSLGAPLQYAMVSPSILSCLAGLSWFKFEGSTTSIALVTTFWVVLLLIFFIAGWMMLRTHVRKIRVSRQGDYVLSATTSPVASPLKLVEADPTAKDYPGIFISICKTSLLGTSFLYLPVTVACLSVFQCESDPSNGKQYMVYAPDTECSTSDTDYKLMRQVSIVLLPTVVAGLPITLCVLCYCLRDAAKRRSQAFKQMFEFLHSMYKEETYWYFVVAVLRRLLVAVAVSIIPKKTEVGLPLLFVFLVGFYAHHKTYMPLRVPLLNTLETYALATMLVTYSCGTLFSTNLANEAFTTAVLSVTLWPYLVLYLLLLADLLAEGRLSLLLAEFAEEKVPVHMVKVFFRRVNDWVHDRTLDGVSVFPGIELSSPPNSEKEVVTRGEV